MPKRFKKYERNTRRAQIYLDKELDLKNFITRLRISTMTTLGLLTLDQNNFTSKMSELVLEESSGQDPTDTD